MRLVRNREKTNSIGPMLLIARPQEISRFFVQIFPKFPPRRDDPKLINRIESKIIPFFRRLLGSEEPSHINATRRLKFASRLLKDEGVLCPGVRRRQVRYQPSTRDFPNKAAQKQPQRVSSRSDDPKLINSVESKNFPFHFPIFLKFPPRRDDPKLINRMESKNFPFHVPKFPKFPPRFSGPKLLNSVESKNFPFFFKDFPKFFEFV